jgi:hypothetical protein
MAGIFFANFAFGAVLSHLWANAGHSEGILELARQKKASSHREEGDPSVGGALLSLECVVVLWCVGRREGKEVVTRVQALQADVPTPW